MYASPMEGRVKRGWGFFFVYFLLNLRGGIESHFPACQKWCDNTSWVQGRMVIKNKLTTIPLALMLFAAVYSFLSPSIFYLMGYSAIPIYIIAAIVFFIPFAFMIIEYGAAFKIEKGGIYSWMEKSVGEKYALTTMFMWYSAVIVFLVSLYSVFWIRFSALLFGKDTTPSWGFLGLNSPQTTGLLAIAFVTVMTFVATKGLKQIARIGSIGGVAGLFLNLILILGAIIILIAKNGVFAEPVSISALIYSPNPGYSSMLAVISFVTYAVLSYGGMELSGGYVDKTENPETTFPKAILICAFLITIAYSLGVVLIGIFTNYRTFASQGANLGNAVIVVMNNLGYELGSVFGLTETSSVLAGEWMTRLYSLSVILMVLGQLATVLFSPVRQLIEGTPAKFWPEKISEIEDGIPKRAMWIQCSLIIAFLLLVSFGGAGADMFFNMVILSAAVALSVPYMLIAIAFPIFKKKTEIKKPITLFKSYKSSLIWTIIVVFSVGFANVITVIMPAISGDMFSSVVMVAGPIVFSVIALLLYRRYRKITKAENHPGHTAPDQRR
jgi:amino acid transporter